MDLTLDQKIPNKGLHVQKNANASGKQRFHSVSIIHIILATYVDLVWSWARCILTINPRRSIQQPQRSNVARATVPKGLHGSRWDPHGSTLNLGWFPPLMLHIPCSYFPPPPPTCHPFPKPSNSNLRPKPLGGVTHGLLLFTQSILPIVSLVLPY
jgi:hypothetical protein